MGIYRGTVGMKILTKKKKDKSPGALGAVGTAILIFSITPFVVAVSYLIVLKTGIWWFPLLFGFLSSLRIPTAYWIERRERNNYHVQVGHELYYSENPDELKRKLKKTRKTGIPEKVRRTAAFYRSRPVRVTKFTEIREKKRRRRAALLYMGVAVTAFLGVSMIVRAFPFPKDLLNQGLKTADFTSIFLIIGGVLALITAAGLYSRKPIRHYRYVAAIMIVLSIWSSYVAYTLNKRPSYIDSIISAVSLVVFIFFAFTVPAIAGDTRTAEQLCNDRKELKHGQSEIFPGAA